MGFPRIRSLNMKECDFCKGTRTQKEDSLNEPTINFQGKKTVVSFPGGCQ